MTKKLICVVLSVLVIIVIIYGVLYVMERNERNKRLEKATGIIGEGLTLIRQGKYDEGLNRCKEAEFGAEPCYVTLLNMEMGDVLGGKNNTITKDFCDSISTGGSYPQWAPIGADLNRTFLDTKNKCYEFLAITANDLSICDSVVTFKTSQYSIPSCYIKIARQEKNIEICNKINYQNEKDVCYYLLAIDLSDINLCGLITNKDQREECSIKITQVS